MPITIDVSDFRRAAAAIEGTKFHNLGGTMVATVLREGGNAVRRHVRAELKPHRRSGKTASHVYAHRTGSGWVLVVRVGAGSRVGHVIEGGAKAHDIRSGYESKWGFKGNLTGGASKTRALTIRGSRSPNSAYAGYGLRSAGADVMALRKVVHHPGMAGTHFFEHGIHEATPEVQTIFTKEAEAMTQILAARMRGVK